MNVQILVVGACPADRGHLERLLDAKAEHSDTMQLRYANTLAEAGAPGRLAAPDLILLAAAACSPAPSATGYRGAPILFLAAAEQGRGGTAAPPAGDTSRVVLATATPQQLREQISRAVMGAGMPASTGDTVLNAITDGVISSDVQGRLRYVNPAAARLLGREAGQLLGAPAADAMRLHALDSGAAIEHPLNQVLASGHALRLEGGAILVRGDGTEIIIDDSSGPIFDAEGALNGAVMVFHDITSDHELRAQVDYLAWHDFLTGLPNRFAAERHLNRILDEARTRGTPLAVMYLDLDKFKSINDSFGHAAGDQLLVSVAQRLRECFRMQDLISRQGGDEFLVLMAPGTGQLDASNAAGRIHKAMARPHQLNGKPTQVGCSIGIALYPEHGATGADLLRHADAALHCAKADGRNTWRFFNQGLLSSAVRRRQLEDGLRYAMHEHQFQLFYQPKVRLSDGALCGCEALLRWRHPDWGWVAPGRFIRAAEESGFIVELGRWALHEAIRQARLWETGGQLPGAVAVNVSALELGQADFADHLEQHIALVGLAPGLLQLELTESSLMRDITAASAMMSQLKRAGLSLAIDDFGTGYSSLSYLAELPIDLLKVDRAFVHGIDHATPRKRTLLRAILELAHSLGLPAVAEGIETSLEAGFLSDSGCALGQGYFYSRALTAGAFEQRYLAT